ncbi:MAG TPA: Zn-dependent hydrolase [Anaerolineae bacterium]|nr:Zn-dependent hydrolase [Anaerolineae bacterium]
MQPIQIDAQQLLDDLAAIAQIGRDPAGGVSRLAYTLQEQWAREWFVEQARAIGLLISADSVGNILALEPDAGDLTPVLSGSHLDSVPRGGNFDGMLGVATALAAVRAIREQVGTSGRRPLGVLLLAAEESSRFGSGCLGSRMLIGEIQPADLHKLVDAEGVTLFQAMEQMGLQPDQLSAARRDAGWFHEFIELHVDQADDLFKAEKPLGMVVGIAAPTRLRIVFAGQAAHSGATLMDQRHDALVGSAELILAIEAAARSRMTQEIVATVGILQIEPGAMNVIPGRAELGVDIRGIAAQTVGEVVQAVRETAEKIAQKRGLTVVISTISQAQPLTISAENITRLEKACQAVGVESMRMVSRSAHDALYLGRQGAVSMLFVRNPAGISHNPAEAAWDADVVQGAAVLATYMAEAGRIIINN